MVCMNCSHQKELFLDKEEDSSGPMLVTANL